MIMSLNKRKYRLTLVTLVLYIPIVRAEAASITDIYSEGIEPPLLTITPRVCWLHLLKHSTDKGTPRASGGRKATEVKHP